jgi:hypothetical protein
MIKQRLRNYLLWPVNSSILLLLLLSVLGMGANAQTTVTVPVNNDNDNEQGEPYVASNAYHRTQALYKANEIGISGNITSIGFYVNDINNPMASTPIVIKMKNTHAANLSTMNYGDASSDAVTVYTGNILNTQLSANSWVTVTLPVPFTYAGYNLEVFVETNAGSPGMEDWDAKVFRWSDAGYRAAQLWSGWNTPPGPDDYGYTQNNHPNVRFTIATAPAMSYASSKVSQIPANTYPGATKQVVVGIQVEMAGLTSPMSATSFALSTAGSAATFGLIQNARLYYTGISPVFDTTTIFGSPVPSPSGTFSINGTQVLDAGTNYFWLAYDVSGTALVDDSLDAACSQITIGGINRTPTITAPSGNMLVGNLYDFEGPSNQDFSALSLNNSSNEWQRGTPTYGPAGAYSGTTCWGTNLSGDFSRSADYVLTTPSFVCGNNPVSVGYKEWYDFAYQYNSIDAIFEYEVNGSGFWSELKSVNLNSGYVTSDWVPVYSDVPVSPGDTVRFRWHFTTQNWSDEGPGWYIDNFVVAGANTYNQTFLGSTTNQVSTMAAKGDRKREVISVVIDASGTRNPLFVSDFSFTTGTASTNIIESATLYYTGGSKAFDTTAQFGTSVPSPNGPFFISGSQALTHGPNYFWLAYDISPAATPGDSVDATCTQITISSLNHVPTETNPEGVLPIARLYNFDTASTQSFSAYSLMSTPNEWQKGTPTYGPSGAYSGAECWGTNLNGDYSTNTEYVFTSPSYVAQTDVVSAGYLQWFDFSWTWAGVGATFEYQVNNSGNWSMLAFVDNGNFASSNNKWENVFTQAYVTPGDTIQFRWNFNASQWASVGPGWYIDNFAVAGAQTFGQSFLSSTVNGVVAAVAPGQENQPVIDVTVDMLGTDNALPLTEIMFTTNGTGNLATIKKARVLYTGNDKEFSSTATQFGADIVAPGNTFTVTGSQVLMAGANHFWLAYDVDSNAVLNDSLDAEATQITVATINHTPDVTTPADGLTIGKLYNFDTIGFQSFMAMSQNQNPNQWEKGTPGYGPGSAYSGNECWGTNLGGDYNQNADYTLYSPQFVITSPIVNIGFRQWFDFIYTFSNITADFQYEINNGGWSTAYFIDNNSVANSNNKWEHIQSSFAGMNIGDTIRFSWHFTTGTWSSQGPGWYIDNFIVSGVEKFNQKYVQSYVRQVGESTLPDTRNQAIISIAVETSGTENPLSITDFNLGTTGSVPGLAGSAKLFYTGLNPEFDTTVQFGTTVTMPGTPFFISGNQTLAAGINYFWLAYDLAPGAMIGDSLDGECTQITISTLNYTPTDGAPQGNIPVGRMYNFDTTSTEDFNTTSLNNNPSQWEKGVPTSGPSAAFSGSQCWGTNLAGNYSGNSAYVFATPPYVMQSDISYVSYNQWFDFEYTWNGVEAYFEYNVNNTGWSSIISIDNTMRSSSDNKWEKMSTSVYANPGDTIQYRWRFYTAQWSSLAPGWYVDNFAVSGVRVFDQAYNESYAEQIQGVTYGGAINQPVIRVVVDARGSANALEATAFDFGIGGSVPNIVKTAKLFYTGNTDQFNSAVQYGSTVSTPGAAFSISGTQKLMPGNNYFWLAYDVDSAAADGDSVDGVFNQLTIGFINTYAPSTTSPAGILPVGHMYGFDPGAEDFSTASLNTKPSEWEHGVPVPGAGPAAAYSGTKCWGTNLGGNFTIKSDYVLLSPPLVAKTSEMNLSYRQWFEFIYTSWNKQAEFQYQVNNSGFWSTISYIDLQNVSSSNNNWLLEEAQLPVTQGDTIQFRWRLYTGTWDPAPGWYIDNFLISGAEALDVLPPSISYTPLSHIGNNLNRTLTNFANISDITGVDVLTGTKPRIYYKKKSEANAFVGNSSADNGWKYTEATNSSSPFSFTIDYSLLTATPLLNDTIQYFITAQDVNTQTNVGAYPSVGFSATAVSAITSAPTTPSSYVITAPPMSGNYNVGAGQVYTTVSQAVSDVNLRGVNGPVTLSLTNNNYSILTGETFPITFYPVAGASATNTITVKPAAATSVTFTANNAIFKIQGADNIIIDGSNNGTTSRDLTIQSTGNTGMIWLCANSATDGAEYNTVKNMILRGDLTTKFGVYSGHKDYTSVGSGTLAPSSNNIIENNLITRTVYGIAMVGASATKRDVNNTITKNQIGNATEWVLVRGIYTSYHQGVQVLDNTISNLNFSYLNFYDPAACIYLDQTKQAVVKGNKLSNWRSTAGDTRLVGIYIDGGEDGWNHPPLVTNNLVANNFVANGFSTSTNTWSLDGIYVINGNSDKVYFNTVSLTGAILVTDGTVRAFFSGYDNLKNMNVRNNIFQINGTSAYNTTFIAYSTSVLFPTGGIVSDYNVLSSVGAGSASAFIGEYNYNYVSSLADWRTQSGADVHSTDGLVTFVSATDLHIAGASIGDSTNLGGIAIAGFGTDIDGDTRHIWPYRGADENLTTPLPVNMLEFNGIAKRNDVLLNWSTASEQNNKGFAVERSSDNRTFEQIGFVNGRGNSNSVSVYAYTDKDAFAQAGVWYYRLKQVDKNGSFAYSRTIRVSRGSADALASTVVYPNPFNKDVFVQVETASASSVQVTLTDLTGRVIMNNTFETVKGMNTINVLGNNELESGVYFLTIEANGDKQVQKLIKQ